MRSGGTPPTSATAMLAGTNCRDTNRRTSAGVIMRKLLMVPQMGCPSGPPKNRFHALSCATLAGSSWRPRISSITTRRSFAKRLSGIVEWKSCAPSSASASSTSSSKTSKWSVMSS